MHCNVCSPHLPVEQPRDNQYSVIHRNRTAFRLRSPNRAAHGANDLRRPTRLYRNLIQSRLQFGRSGITRQVGRDVSLKAHRRERLIQLMRGGPSQVPLRPRS